MVFGAVLFFLEILIQGSDTVVFISQGMIAQLDNKDISPVMSGMFIESYGTSNSTYLKMCIRKCLTEFCCFGEQEGAFCKLYGRKNATVDLILWDTYQVRKQKNVARYGIPTQSSNYTSSYTAKKGIDGDLTTWANTAAEANPWWKIDLQKNYFIMKLCFSLRVLSRFHSITMYLSKSSATPDQYHGLPVFAINAGAPTSSPICFTAISGVYGMWGRYLIIQAAGSNIYYEMLELEIFSIV